MKKILFGLVILIAIAAGAFLKLRDKENKVRFKTEKLTRGNIQQVVSATGTVNAVVTVLVGTQVSGTIKEIFADFNSPVKQGQMIARIDPTILEAQEDQAKANLMAAKANVKKSEAALLDAERTMMRNKALFAKDLIARSDLETSETGYQSALAQVTVSKAQVAQTQAALNYSQTNLRYTRILSPVDGIVVSRNVDVGQTVAASFQTPTLFNIAQDLTKMQINTNVDEADIGTVKTDQNVEFTVDAYPDIIFKGKVSQVRNSPINVQNVITYDVIIKVDNSDLKLKPGMTANVSIIIAGKENVLIASSAALRFKPYDKASGEPEQKGYAVWIIENNKPKRMKITPGISDGNFTEILSDTLEEGLEVIVESLGKSKDQQSMPRGPRFF